MFPSLACPDSGKGSLPSIKQSDEAHPAVKLEEKEASEPSDSKEKAGLSRPSDHVGGEKYSPKVSILALCGSWSIQPLLPSLLCLLRAADGLWLE